MVQVLILTAPYPTQPTTTFDASYDQKINDLKRQLEKVKLEQPSTPSTIRLLLLLRVQI
jgi:hypothetical protein